MSKLEEMEDNEKNELLAQEMKYKSQVKQAKTEMRKIMVAKGILDPPSEGVALPLVEVLNKDS